MIFTRTIGILCLCALATVSLSCDGENGTPDAASPVADAAVADAEPGADSDLGGFCGFSTGGPCSSDADCYSGGCSGQVCQSIEEEPILTTCEWRECYDDVAYGVECGCVARSCSWRFE